MIERDGVKIAFVGFAPVHVVGAAQRPGRRQGAGRAGRRRAPTWSWSRSTAAPEGSDAQHVPRGDETYLGEDRGDLRKFARTAINAGADLVVGSGPHVVRGMEFYKGHLIAYSAGNFVGYGGVFGLSGPTAVSYVLQVRLRSDGRFRSAQDHPHAADRSGHRRARFLGAGDHPRALAHAGRFPVFRGANRRKWCDPAADVVICDRRSSWPIQERTSVWFAGTCTSSVRDREVPIVATGTVKWFNDAKGFGFVEPDEGGKDLFVHFSNIAASGFRSLPEGAKVEYEARQGTKGPEAINVTLL